MFRSTFTVERLQLSDGRVTESIPVYYLVKTCLALDETQLINEVFKMPISDSQCDGTVCELSFVLKPLPLYPTKRLLLTRLQLTDSMTVAQSVCEH